MTKQVFLIEQLWTDYLENSVERALGYTPIGIARSEEIAKKLIADAGVVEQQCWAMHGPMPKLRYKALPMIGSADEPKERP